MSSPSHIPDKETLAIALVLVIVFATSAALVIAAASVATTPVTNNNDGVVLNRPNGPAVTLVGDTSIYNNSGGSDDTLQLNTTDGNISARAPNDASFEIDTSHLEGTWTNTTNIDASAAELRINPETKPPLNVTGAVSAVSYRDDITIGGGGEQVVYSASGNGTITVTGLAPDEKWVARQPGGDEVDHGVTTSNGEAAISVGAETDASLTLVSPEGPPSLSGLSPTSNVNNENVELSVDVEDPDFGSHGDEVTVEFFVNGTNVGTDILTSNGTATTTATDLAEGQHDWHVEAVDDYGLSTTSNTYTFEVKHYAPVADNSAAEPRDGISQYEVPFSVPVNDTDFAEASGDEVNVSFYIDGEYRESINVTSNGTVSTDLTVSTGGEHTWHIKMVDEYGKTNRSDANESAAGDQNFTFSAPGELEIYNETNPGSLVDQTVEVSMYFAPSGQEDVYNRTVKNGTIDMTGLPADKSFVVVASSDGYFNRRIWVESLFETQRIYLMPESADAVQPTFTLTDYTGNYPLDSTVLELQRSINGSWETVEADYFGAANQLSAVLEFNERHRVVIHNVKTGQSRNLGVLTPVETTTIVIEVHQEESVFNPGAAPTVNIKPQMGYLPSMENVSLPVELDENNVTIDTYTVRVEVNGTTVTNETYLGPEGDQHDLGLNLSEYAGEKANVSVSWVTSDDESGQVTRVYDVKKAYTDQPGLLRILPHAPGSDTPNGISSLMALFATALMVGFVATQTSTEAAGAVGVLAFGAFALIDWVAIGWFFAVALVWLLMTASRRSI